ncbi:hypothetical protein J3458_003202 [Metarhizium acridum]|uniref:uncharacterized protein n=1 Tax=Metarhizium acridum TaxID=92637 RepID=UPI001C6AB389|nr:hypothetical protein J3458_003202 [Metarhizium acridum]
MELVFSFFPGRATTLPPSPGGMHRSEHLQIWQTARPNPPRETYTSSLLRTLDDAGGVWAAWMDCCLVVRASLKPLTYPGVILQGSLNGKLDRQTLATRARTISGPSVRRKQAN